MKILHTSDWHLGRTLYTKKDRLEEHTVFFNVLLEVSIIPHIQGQLNLFISYIV